MSEAQSLSHSGGTPGDPSGSTAESETLAAAGGKGKTGATSSSVATAFRGIAGAGSIDSCEHLCDASMHCYGDVCSSLECHEGWADCNGNAADGCEVRLSTDPANCGACNVSCSHANGAPSCTAGECTISCAEGYADCDAILANGCETNLTLSVKHCGECGRACLDAVNGTAQCQAGDCKLSNCAAPYGDCDGNRSNGCESDGTSDVRNCGGCGVACSLPHAAASCAHRACIVQACEEGWADCNGVAADGCEIHLTSNPAHCGACNTNCAPPDATGACVNAECVVGSCRIGRGDCNEDAGDGCESELDSDLANCGACGVACQATHGTTSCEVGACQIQCAAGYASCDDNEANGCETEIQSNTAHCGGCNQRCEGKCVKGSCYTRPCSGLCENPTVFTVGVGAVSGISERVCHESYEATKPFTSGNCGLFLPGSVLQVNGKAVECGVESWGFTAATRPAPRYGGYCFHDNQTGANGATAWFNVW